MLIFQNISYNNLGPEGARIMKYILLNNSHIVKTFLIIYFAKFMTLSENTEKCQSVQILNL
jgi:hypothetical protein